MIFTRNLFWLMILLGVPQQSYCLDRESLGEDCYEILHSDDRHASAEVRRACLEQLRGRPVLVITPTRQQRTLDETPAAVSVVTRGQIERQGASDVAELLRSTPGVNIADAGQAGQKRIRLRGEDSRHVAIQIDGQEFADERQVGTPLLIAPEMIEQIEVVRGPGSLLHGSRALGGTVNIITKKGGYHPFQGSVSSLYDSATDGYQNFASVYGKIGGTRYRVAGAQANHKERETPDGKIENTAYDNQSYLLFLSQEVEWHNLGVMVDSYKSSSEVYVEPRVRTTPPFLDFRIEAPRRDRQKASLFYDFEAKGDLLDKFHLDAYLQKSQREFNTFSTLETVVGERLLATDVDILNDSELETLGANSQLDLRLSPDFKLVSGLKVKTDELEQSRKRRVSGFGPDVSEERTDEQSRQETVELFIFNEWSALQDLTVFGGVRGYKIQSRLRGSSREGLHPRSADAGRMVGAFGASYQISDTLMSWVNWSQGYMHPSLVQLATGAFAGPNFVNPNFDLAPETSNSFEIGLRASGDILIFDTAVFYSKGKRFIDHVPCSASGVACVQPEGGRDRVFVNIDRSHSYGLELAARVSLQKLTPYSNLTLLRRRYEDDNERSYYTGVPGLSSQTGVQLEHVFSPSILGWADFYLQFATRSREQLSNQLEVDEKGGWATLNLQLGSEFGEKRQYKLTLDFLNIGDKLFTHATENLPARGRSAIIKFSASI